MILERFLGIISKNALGMILIFFVCGLYWSFCDRSLPEMEGLSKETVLTSWMAKFDCILKGKLRVTEIDRKSETETRES